MLEVANLTMEHESNTVLNGVNFSLKEQERVALVGANGSGKSTLIRCILGLCRYRGTVSIRTKSLGYVPQNSAIPSDVSISVREFLSSAISSSPLIFAPKKEIEEKLHQGLKSFSLEPSILNSRIGHLSGGETMKILFLRAILGKPELLILDEPEQSLDEEGRSTLISALKTQGTCLVVSHDADLISEVCTRKLVLENGSIFKS